MRKAASAPCRVTKEKKGGGCGLCLLEAFYRLAGHHVVLPGSKNVTCDSESNRTVGCPRTFQELFGKSTFLPVTLINNAQSSR